MLFKIIMKLHSKSDKLIALGMGVGFGWGCVSTVHTAITFPVTTLICFGAGATATYAGARGGWEHAPIV
jgi:hypothetical protein